MMRRRFVSLWLGVVISLVLCVGTAQSAPGLLQTKKRAVTVETLMHDLKSPDPVRRKEAARALGENRVRSAVPGLVDAAADPDEEVRREVAQALDRIRDPQAIPALVKLSADSSRDVRRRSLAAMVNLYVMRETGLIAGTKKVADFLNPFSSENDDLQIESYTKVDPAVIRALRDRLSDRDNDVREDTAKALGILRAKEAVPDMRAALKAERENSVRVAFMRSFYKIADPSVGPDLVPLIRDSDKRVHDEAIRTLGLLRVKEAIPELTRMYESGVEERRKILKVVPASSSEDLQLKALQSLAMIADSSSEDNFAKALRHPSAGFRQAGAEGLARLAPQKPDQATEVSRARLAEKDNGVRLAESFALYRMGRKEYLDDLVTALGKVTLHNQAEGYLLEFTQAEQKDLYPHLSSPNNKVRERLCGVLGQIGDDEALAKIQPLIRDRDSGVVAAANQATRRLNGRRTEK